MEIRKTSPVIDVLVTATEVYLLSTGRKGKLRKVWAYNSDAAEATFYFCNSEGTRWTPDIKVLSGGAELIGELDLPAYEFAENLHALASATGIRLMVEVEEY